MAPDEPDRENIIAPARARTDGELRDGTGSMIIAPARARANGELRDGTGSMIIAPARARTNGELRDGTGSMIIAPARARADGRPSGGIFLSSALCIKKRAAAAFSEGTKGGTADEYTG